MVTDERMYYTRHVEPHIGQLPVKSVRSGDINRVLEQAVSLGLRRKSVQEIRSLLKRMFDMVWREEFIRENPVMRTCVPEIRETKKQRAILTDKEFYQFMESPKVDSEIKLLSIFSRTLGGMRASELIRWDWSMIITKSFPAVVIVRTKTNSHTDIIVPDEVIPYLLARWNSMGRPTSGSVFPVERGKRAGERRASRGVSFAKRLRGGFIKAGIFREKPIQIQHADGSVEFVPNPLDPLYFETDTTLPVDFHSWRRGFSTGLAGANVNAQHSMYLSSHTDLKVHLSYVMRTIAMMTIPKGALPPIPPVELSLRVTKGGEEPDQDTKTASFTLADEPGGTRSSGGEPAEQLDPPPEGGWEHVDRILKKMIQAGTLPVNIV